jgi:ribosomal-protein-serine acetyltransferase
MQYNKNCFLVSRHLTFFFRQRIVPLKYLQPIMTFDNYILRPLQSGDAEGLLVLVTVNRERISNYLPKTAKAITDKRSVHRYIKEKMKNAEEMREFCFLIIDKDTEKPCGAIFLKSFEWTIPKCELGYFIDAAYEGKGIITKGLKEITHYCFEKLKINKLFLRSAVDNHGSKRVAEKSGFLEEGILRKDFMTRNGELVDVVYYGLIKE